MSKKKKFLDDVYFEDNNYIKEEPNSEFSIRSELVNKGLSDDVIDEAVNISNTLKVTPRKGDKKKELIFLCVYYAYKNLNKPETPRNIDILLNFPIKKIQSKLNKFNYQGSYNIVSFVDMIPRCCIDLKVSEEYQQDILKFGEKINKTIAKSSILNEKFPHDVAYCIVLFYLNIHGYCLDIDFIKDKTGMSTTSINIINKEIANTYNGMK